MKNVQKIDLGLTGYDELFMNDAERQENKLPRIYDVPISEIDDFPDHPFKVKVDEDMAFIREISSLTPMSPTRTVSSPLPIMSAATTGASRKLNPPKAICLILSLIMSARKQSSTPLNAIPHLPLM